MKKEKDEFLKLAKIYGLIALCVNVVLIALFCIFIVPNCISVARQISPTGTIEWSNGPDSNNILYNNKKYNMIPDGKLVPILDSEHYVKIATLPDNYLLGTVIDFYGTDEENPKFIVRESDGRIWTTVYDDFNSIIWKNLCVINDSFSFQMADVTTNDCLVWEMWKTKTVETVVVFEKVPLQSHPAVGFQIEIARIDGNLYLRCADNSSYYEITDEFETQLRENGFIN